MFNWTPRNAYRVGFFLIVFMGISQSFISSLEYFDSNEIHETWAEVLETFHKEELVNKLKSQIGYGGFIHHYKSYAIQKNLILWNLAQSDLQQAAKLIEEYRTLNITFEEQEALKDIEETLTTYQNALEKMRFFVAEGYTTEEIENILPVFDGAALAGFETLSAEAEKAVEQSHYEISNKLNEDKATAFVDILLLFFAIFAYVFLANIVKKLTIDTEKKANYLASINESLPCGVLVTDENGNIESVNREAQSMRAMIRSGDDVISNISDILPEARDFMALKQLCVKNDGHFALKNDQTGQDVYLFLEFRPFNDGGYKKYVITLLNVTERERTRQSLNQSLAEVAAFNSLLNNHASVTETDLKGNITYANERFCKLTGYSLSEVVGKNHRILNSGKHPKLFWKSMWKTISSGEIWHGEVTNKRKDGSTYWILSTIMPFKDGQGNIYKYVSARTDITRIKIAESQIHQIAYRDPLTQQPNLAYFKDTLDEMIDKLDAAPELGKLIIADISIHDLMDINSTFGWDFGDKLIKNIAQRLEIADFNAEILAKVSGDRFALLMLCDGYVPEFIEDFKIKLAALFVTPFNVDSKPVKVAYSAGVVVYPEDLKEVGSFAHSASNINNYLELCKVEASKRHGNYCVRFNVLLLQNVSKRTVILQSIEKAQNNNELFMVYQPQISLKDESVVGVEALMRWKKEDGSVIAPGDFIPVLEMSEFISDITFWANQQCFSDLQKITSKLPNCRLSLNISANILVKERLLESLTNSIKEYNLKPEQIELEVTESAIMEDMDAALTQIRKLRDIGFRVSIDDFGTGHSSLSYLVEFPIDQLKIDKSFIRQITKQKQSLTVVNTIISLGKDLGLDVIAEGAETQEQVTLLKQHHCDEAQGFYFAKPMPLPELLVWLEQKKSTEKIA